MQELFVKSWCDGHLSADRDARVEARVTVQIALDGDAMRELDVCDDCASAFFDPLRELMALSRPAESASASKRTSTAPPAREQRVVQPRLDETRVECFVCDLDFANPKSLRTHWKNKHLSTLGTLGSVFGEQCPLCGDSFGNLGVHAARTHHVDTVYELVAQARQRPDKFGVLAAIDERQGQMRRAGRSAA